MAKDKDKVTDKFAGEGITAKTPAFIDTASVSAPYEEKFAEFIRACEAPIDVMIVRKPEDLGDNYLEVMESLRRVAKNGKSLMIRTTGE